MSTATATVARWSALRLRQSAHLRDLCVETSFTVAHLIQPIFVVEGLAAREAMTSLDLIGPIREVTGRLVGAYQLSGEYAGLCALGREGLADFDAALLETWHVFRRAGAAYVITYGARRARSLGVPA